MNDYQKRENEKTIKLIPQLNDASMRHEFFTWGKKDNDKQLFIVARGKTPIKVKYQEYFKTYHFFLDHKLPYIDRYTEKEVREKIGKPNNIHKLNRKAVDKWIDFLKEVYQKLKVISAERVLRLSTFEAKMRQAGAKISEKEYGGCFSGDIIKNGLQYNFEVSDTGYISEKISTHYSVPGSFEAFKGLADNNYKMDA